ncbi:hypothetical protein DFP72DRAFT_1077726 [Ephemerocybe angulata]|uniref:Uncharacterized protein n=1 Tax=Ephemerocybe angulata TaxID=980116 RepID=A0A8H6HE38_9AGAR|nr:hypothetical protein DFP72DRAFT_1080289 [Tulosesus angulatus]KAF6745288.1 hypothetical protein DFP72DRAFT_1077726 [Tulosesus angulatus]
MERVPIEILEKIVALYIQDLPRRPRYEAIPLVPLALVLNHRTLVTAMIVSWRSIWVNNPRHIQGLLEKAADVVDGKRLGDQTRVLRIGGPRCARAARWEHRLPDLFTGFPNIHTSFMDFRRYGPRCEIPWGPLKTCVLPYPTHLTRLQIDEAPSVNDVAAVSASIPRLQFLAVRRVASPSPRTTTALEFPALTHLALGDSDHSIELPCGRYKVLMGALAVGGSIPNLETLELLNYDGDSRPLLKRFGKQLKSLSHPTRSPTRVQQEEEEQQQEGEDEEQQEEDEDRDEDEDEDEDEDGDKDKDKDKDKEDGDEDEEEKALLLCPDIRTLKLFLRKPVRIHTPMNQLTTVEIFIGRQWEDDDDRRSEDRILFYDLVHQVCRIVARLAWVGVADRHRLLDKVKLLEIVADAVAEKQITFMYSPPLWRWTWVD